ncbi:hypothetical protein KKZ84_21995, partial [Enterobacter hormaechei subsp. xiangfangensis]|nr:hypothetical protein [Enterobacter hormaechei subsp. xiangfangensis]
ESATPPLSGLNVVSLHKEYRLWGVACFLNYLRRFVIEKISKKINSNCAQAFSHFQLKQLMLISL